MGNLVKNLIKRGCITIKDNSEIDELVSLLNKNSIGCIVVLSSINNTLVGVVSERDIIRNFSHITNNIKTKVHEVMTNKVITCSLSTSSEELMEIMTNNRIRHIPIIERKKLIGIVSIGDVVNRLIKNYADETRQLREYIYS